MKNLPALLKKAQETFNAWVRRRDKNKPCISCTIGQPEQAGHYIPVGRSSYLRFSELNVSGQCVACNCSKYGNPVAYRKELVKKVGEDAVLKLEQDAYKIKKWNRDELFNIIENYK